MTTKKDDGLPSTGFLRLPSILALFPVSKSTWWKGVAEGRFPKPVKLGPRVTAWRTADIRELLHRAGDQGRIELVASNPQEAPPKADANLVPRAGRKNSR